MGGILGGLLGGLTGAGGGDPIKAIGGLVKEVEGLLGGQGGAEAGGHKQDGIDSSGGGLSSLMNIAQLAAMFV